ncbi:MAG: UDP-glucose/GDP-mannose dehydrogenase family protein [Parachlamydiales bacterium]|jgi:UDPglucose 6-dehydrogenase
MRLLIIGTGYVGLVSGVCFAEMGHETVCLDIDELKIEKLKKGKAPIYEPGLEELLERNLKAKRLHFSTSYEEVKKASAIFLALPTPSRPDGSCNTSYLESAVREIALHFTSGKTLINKSTAPMGTLFKLKKLLLNELKEKQPAFWESCQSRAQEPFEIVSNPEFLKEGSAILDCMKPDRIIIGANSPSAFATMREIYDPFMLRSHRIIEMDILSAELTKYASNAMLATRISFMNELSKLCQKEGANINQVRLGIGSDSRIGDKFLYAGIGYGGSCFPKDLRALIAQFKELGIEPKLMEAVESVNENQKKELARHIQNYFQTQGGIKGKTIAIWGLAFKPDTDDMRDAPSISIVKELTRSGAILRLYDPISMEKAKEFFQECPNIIFCKSEQEAAHKADAVALLTEWKQFRLIDFDPILKKMNHLAFFDGRNQYKPEEMQKRGFKYFSIGNAHTN